MNPRARLRTVVALLAVFVGLVIAFPRVLAFTELAARELRYFWWMILAVALGGWLIWGVGRRPRR